MKNKFYFLAAALLGFLTFSAPVKAASFLEGYEDIPVMRGLRQIPSDTISFGNEETRLVEAMLTGSKVGFKSVKKFYVDLSGTKGQQPAFLPRRRSSGNRQGIGQTAERPFYH